MRHNSNMETLIINKLGKDIWEWKVSTEEHNILYFLWNRFIKSAEDSITDYQNESKIKERAKELTEYIQEDNNKLESKVLIQEKDISKKDSKIQALQEEIDILRENRLEDIKHQVESSNESKNELIMELKEQNMSLKEEKKEQCKIYEAREDKLRQELKEITINNTNKNNKSSYENGIEGEKKLFELLREESEFCVKDTHGASHKGDAEVKYLEMRLCIDAKQYKTTCPHKESSKLVEDVEKNSYDGGVLISWDSGIYDPQTSTKIKDLIFNKIINGKPYVFISQANSIPDSLLISAIKELKNNKISNDSLNTIQMNEKITEELASMIDCELKELDSSDKTLKIKERRNTERRKILVGMQKEYNLSNYTSKTSQKDIVTEICTHLGEIKQEYKSQRNSTRDIKSYLEQYLKKNKINYDKFTESDLKKALDKEHFESNKIKGKNYKNIMRKNDSITWNIELLPELLN